MGFRRVYALRMIDRGEWDEAIHTGRRQNAEHGTGAYYRDLARILRWKQALERLAVRLNAKTARGKHYHQLIQCGMREDHGISTLIDLNEQVIDQGGGYWVKIEAWRVEVTAEIPHGIRYSLTRHEPYGKRILGYGNAHAVKPPKKFKYAGRRLTYDHKHRHTNDKGMPCEFQDAQQLLIDFFNEVDRVLKEARQK